MTTIQRTSIGAAFVIAALAIFYATREKVEAQRQEQAAQTARAQQETLTHTVERLQRERDEATNQLAAATELARTKAAQTPSETLKLRGQVGSLRQQLASAEAKSNSPSSGFAKMMSDPAMREYINQAMNDLIKKRYSSLFQELKLTPEQSDQFMQVLSAEFQKGAQRLAASQQGNSPTPDPGPPAGEDKEKLTEKLRAVLGDAGVARFGEYSQEVPARTTVDLLDSQLGANKLTDDQKARLFQAVKAEPFNLTHGISGDLDKAFFGSPEEADSYLSSIADSNQRVLQQAGSFLNDDQLNALNTVLTNGITARKTQAAAFTRKRGG
jgi:hypothetical protein